MRTVRATSVTSRSSIATRWQPRCVGLRDVWYRCEVCGILAPATYFPPRIPAVPCFLNPRPTSPGGGPASVDREAAPPPPGVAPTFTPLPSLSPSPQVAALRQQIARLQSENAALKKTAASATPPLPGSGGKTAAAAAAADAGRWQLLEQMQGDMSGLEMENARLKVQMVRGRGGEVWQEVWGKMQGNMSGFDGEYAVQGPDDESWRVKCGKCVGGWGGGMTENAKPQGSESVSLISPSPAHLAFTPDLPLHRRACRPSSRA